MLSDPTIPHTVSRRDFLRGNLNEQQNQHRQQSVKQELSSIEGTAKPRIETLTMGKLTLETIMPFDHTISTREHRNDLERFFPIIEREINKPEVTGAIVEYFVPEEFTRKIANQSKSLSGDGTEIYDFFKPVDQAIHGAGKPVYVMDPAHDSWWGLIRLTDNVAPAIVGAGVAIKQGFNAFDKPMTRAKAIKTGIKGIVGLGLVANFLGDDMSRTDKNLVPSWPVPSEDTLRRIVVAKGIQDLADSINNDPASKQQRLLVLYPTVHWEAIKTLLENRDLLDKEFPLTQPFLAPLRVADNPYQIRKYTPTQNGWKKEVKGIS